MSQPINKARQSGFTLVELLVSVSLFLLIITVVLGGLVSGIARERESRFKSLLQSEMYAFLDRLEREIHLAEKVGCGTLESDCEDGGSVLVLEDPNGNSARYELVNGKVLRNNVAATSLFGGSVNELTFFVRGALSGDNDPENLQYVVIVTMNSSVSAGGEVYAYRYITPYSLDSNE